MRNVFRHNAVVFFSIMLVSLCCITGEDPDDTEKGDPNVPDSTADTSCVDSTCFDTVITIHEPPDTATREFLPGVWKVVGAMDALDSSFLHDVELPVTAFSFEDFNSIASTAGPLWSYFVFGRSVYASAASLCGEVFDYSDLAVTSGEYFIGGGREDRFVIEMKLQSTGTMPLSHYFEILGISSSDVMITDLYCKFRDVGLAFSPCHDTMTWCIDEMSEAVYKTKDQQGDMVLWPGWSADAYTRCIITLVRQDTTFNYVVMDAYSSGN